MLFKKKRNLRSMNELLVNYKSRPKIAVPICIKALSKLLVCKGSIPHVHSDTPECGVDETVKYIRKGGENTPDCFL